MENSCVHCMFASRKNAPKKNIMLFWMGLCIITDNVKAIKCMGTLNYIAWIYSTFEGLQGIWGRRGVF